MKTLNDQIEEMPEKVSTTVFDRIKALLASPDEKFKALQSSFEALTAEHKQAAADLVSMKKEADDFKAALATMTTERDGLKAKLATAEASVTDFDAKVAQKTRELAAAQGIKIDLLPAQPGAGAGSNASLEKIMAEYYGEADPTKKAALWEQKVKPALGYK